MAMLAFAAAGGAAVAEEPALRRDWLVELKRQNTGRGTEDESTRTQVKVERRLDGPFAFARLELPFPDEDTDFEGSAFRPRLGDVKARLGFAPVDVAGRRFTSYVELAFPTADPASLGTGKYVWQAGARTAWALGTAGSFRVTLGAQASQAVSFGGDPARNDTNTTKLEIDGRLDATDGRFAKAVVKPNIDWVRGGRSGAVAELEAGIPAGGGWAFAALAGATLWGEGVAGTYDRRVELKISRRF